MVYVSRKMIYPIFLVLFIIIFFSLIYFLSFVQSIDVRDAQVEVSGDKVVLTAVIKNISNHSLKDIEILIQNGDYEKKKLLRYLGAGDKNDIRVEMDFSENLSYDVFVSSPFNRTIKIPFKLEEDTIKPVDVQVGLTSNMIVGKEYIMTVKLCNESSNDLHEVYWAEKVEGSYFKESFFPRTIPIGKDQCKTFYPTLTPLVPGKVTMEFILRVGGLEQKQNHVVTISSE